MPPLRQFYHRSQTYLQLAAPLILGNLLEILIPTTDALMVGHLGKQYLAAAELVNSFALVVFLLLVGISHGLVPRVAALVSNGRYQEANSFFKHSLLLNAAIGTVLCLLMYQLAPGFYHLNQDPQVAKLAVPYCQVIAISLLPDMIAMTLMRYLEAVSRTKIIFFSSLLACVSNITLNYIFIFGRLGLPAMELLGAGWGTLATRVLTTLLLGLYVFGAPSMHRYVTPFARQSISWTYVVRLFKVGLPIGLQLSLELAVVAFSVLMMGWISVEAQAAHAIVERLISFGISVTWSFSTAASIMVGSQLGKGNVVTVRSAGVTSFIVAGGISLGISLSLLTTSAQVLPLYGPEANVLAIAQHLLWLAALWNLFDSLYIVGMGILRGLEDTLLPFFITTLIHWGIGLSISYLLAFQVGWGAGGIWWGSIVGYALAGVALAWRFYLKSGQLTQATQ